MYFSFKMNELYPVISSRVFLLDPPPELRVLHQPKEGASKMPWGGKKYQNNQQGCGWWFQPIWKILVKLEMFPK